MTSFSAPLRSLTLIALAAGMAHGAASITNVSPNHGVYTGGTVVVITGTGLGGLNLASEITFGGTAVASVISSSATQLVVTTPNMTSNGNKAIAWDDGSGDTGTYGTSFVAYETNAASLDINISVSIAQTLYLAWTAETIANGTRVAEGDTTAVSWNIGAVTVAQLVETATVTSAASPAAPTAADYNFEVRNTGNGPIDVAIFEKTGSGGGTAGWTLSGTMVPGVDFYVLAVKTPNYTATTWYPLGTADPVNSGQTAAASEITLGQAGGHLAPFATQAFDLLFQAPTSVTTFGTKTMTVTVVATATD